MSILEEIRRFLLPEIIGVEKEIKFLNSKNEDLLKIISKLQDDILQLKERVSKLEMQQEGIEEKISAKIILTLLKHFNQLPEAKKPLKEKD